MLRNLLVGLVTLGAATLASAHFVYILPDKTGAKAEVVFSDDLAIDGDVPLGKVAGFKLMVRDAAGKDVAAEAKRGEVGAQRVEGGAVLLDEHAGGGTAGQRFDTERTGAGEQVGDR